jgi:hypothetical protein
MHKLQAHLIAALVAVEVPRSRVMVLQNSYRTLTVPGHGIRARVNATQCSTLHYARLLLFDWNARLGLCLNVTQPRIDSRASGEALRRLAAVASGSAVNKKKGHVRRELAVPFIERVPLLYCCAVTLLVPPDECLVMSIHGAL